MIKVRNLVKKYGSFTAVNNLNLEVQKGQVVGLLGPNGAGKSTTMNILTGYISPSEGKVEIAGYDILEEPMKAKEQIGYLPEIPPLYQDMTVGEYLKFVAELKKVKKSERKDMVADVMAKVQITDRKKQLIQSLSKGYRQRVGLAAALIGNPPVLILDEPTVGLDPKQIIEMRDLIRSLGKDHSVILSSHYLQEVSAVCDHVIIINKGTVIAEDTPQNLSENFSNHSNLTLEAKGNKETISNILSNKEYVASFEIEVGEEDVCHAKIVMKDDIDHRDELTLALAAEKIPVYSMQKEDLSLEEVFLKLTGDEVPEDMQAETASEVKEDARPNEDESENVDIEDSQSDENSLEEKEEK